MSTPDPAVAWNKAQTAADRLFDCLEALDEAGGISAAAEAGAWTPKALHRAISTLEATRKSIDRQLDSRRSNRPIRRQA